MRRCQERVYPDDQLFYPKIMSGYHHPHQIFGTLAEISEDYALIILTDVNGGTLRARGAVMAVTESGKMLGYISQGCVDADIITHAQSALTNGRPRHISYGEESPFKDIVLPCGGRINLTIIPNPDPNIIAEISSSLSARKAVSLAVSNNGKLTFVSEGQDKSSFSYHPALRLLLAGRGEALKTLAQQARLTGMDVTVLSPDELDGEDVTLLKTPSQIPKLDIDQWTAGVLLFHDHDWETELLSALVKSEAFFIGAMGSQRTHQARLLSLKDKGLSNHGLSRIHGPIGHLPSLRDAGWLSISILSDVAKAARKHGYI